MTGYIDVEQITGETDLYEGEKGQVWFNPYLAYHVEDGADDFLVSTEKLQIRLVDGKAEVELPETPINNLMKVQLRGIRGYGAPWYVQIPAGDWNLFDLPAIDPDTLDPIAPPSPAWLAALESVETDVATNTTDLADLTQTVADLELGAASDTAVATQVTDGTETPAAIDARIADGITGKADTTALTAGLATKQPLDTDLTAIAALAPTDTQQLSYSTSLGTWTVVNPTGASELASAINITGTVTTMSAAGGLGAVVTVPGTAISVTNSGGRPVTLHFQATLQQTIVGQANLYFGIYETTSGAVNRVTCLKEIPNSIAAALSGFSVGSYQLPIGVVTTTRTFDLRGVLYAPAANNPTVQVLNGATAPTVLRAVAG